MEFKDMVDVQDLPVDEASAINFADMEDFQPVSSTKEITNTMQKILGRETFLPKSERPPVQVVEPKATPEPTTEPEGRTAQDEAAALLAGDTFGLGQSSLPGGSMSSVSDPDAPSFGHTVKLFGQTSVISAGEFVDFVRKADNWRKFNGFNLGELEIDGEVIDEASFEELATSLVTAGGTIGLEESTGTPVDTFTKLLAANVGPSGVIGGVVKTAKSVFKSPSNISKFLKEEMSLSFIGATTGTTGGHLFGDDQKSVDDMSELFNMGGMLGAPLLSLLPLNIARKIIKNGKTNPLFNRIDAEGLAEKEVNKHLASLVPEEILPEIRERMALVRLIQKMEPDFQPSNGVLIGTEEALMTQRVVDTNNHKLATSQFLKTKKAVERLTARMLADPKSEDGVKIAAALRLYARETEEFLISSTAKIVGMEERLRNVSDPDFSSSKNGKELLNEYDTVREAYRAERDTLYNLVDPLGEVKLSPDRITAKLTNVLESDDPLKTIEESDKGFNYFTKTLPKILEDMSRRSATPKGPAGVNVSMGFTPKDKPYFTYLDVKGIYEELGKRANKIAKSDPSSDIPRLMNSFREDLIKTLDEDMISGSPEVAARYNEARKFMTDEYYKRFREGAGGKLAIQGDSKVPLDGIGDNFWKKGNKEVSIEEFNDLFSDAHGSLTDPGVALQASVIARQTLSEHAMNTLQDRLKASPKSDPIEILQKWKHEYRGALKTFDDVAERVDDLESSFKTLAVEKKMGATKEIELNSKIISKYALIESSELMPLLMRSTPEEAGRIMHDILRSTSKKGDVSSSYADKYPDSLVPSADAATGLTNAVRRNLTSHLIAASFDAQTEAPSAAKLFDLLSKKGKMLEQVLHPDDIANLHDFQKALKIMGDLNAPLKRPELNKLKEITSKIGVSPASMISRYYAVALGKVGKTFLMADAASRILTGLTSKHFSDVYRKAMYDLDGLENVLRQVGTPKEDMKEFLSMKQAMVDNLKELPKRVRNSSVEKLVTLKATALGFRLNELQEHREEVIGRGEGDKSLLDSVLDANDDLTGQPSRVRPTVIEGAGIEEFMKLSDPDFSLDTPSEALTSPTADVPETDTIVPVKEEQPAEDTTKTPTISAEENAQIDATIPPTKEEKQQTMLQDRAKEFKTYAEYEKHLKSVFTARSPKTAAAFEQLIPQLRNAWDAVHEKDKDNLDAMETLLQGLGGTE